MTTVVLILLFSLVAPLPLIIIERFLPYPFIIEEILKLIFVLFILNQEKLLKRNLFSAVIASGILFSISESIFYLFNIFTLQMPQLFFERLILTGIMHTLTISIIYLLGRRNKYWLIVGFILAIIIHYFYNLLILQIA